MSRPGRVTSRMSRRAFLQHAVAVSLCSGALTLAGGCTPSLAEAPPARRLKLDLWHVDGPTDASLYASLQEGLHALGYATGRLDIQRLGPHWWGHGRLPDLADELVVRNPDILVVLSTPVALVAKSVTQRLPIVMVAAGDPVATGLVASLERPGGNVTGLTSETRLLVRRRLEWLREVIPGLARLAVLGNPDDPDNALELSDWQAIGSAQGLSVQVLEVRNDRDYDRAAADARGDRSEALATVGDRFESPYNRGRIMSVARQNRLPVISESRAMAGAGGLLAYGADLDDLYGRVASYADQLFRGAKPADLPIGRPSRIEFVVNPAAAQALGLTIPQSVLQQATEVIQ